MDVCGARVLAVRGAEPVPGSTLVFNDDMEEGGWAVAVPGTDPGAELIACLEVLAEEVDRWEDVEYHPEFAAAVFQVIELVPLLMQENDQAWDTIDALKQMAAEQAAARQAVVSAPNRAARRQMERRTKGGLVLPS